MGHLPQGYWDGNNFIIPPLPPVAPPAPVQEAEPILSGYTPLLSQPWVPPAGGQGDPSERQSAPYYGPLNPQSFGANLGIANFANSWPGRIAASLLPGGFVLSAAGMGARSNVQKTLDAIGLGTAPDVTPDTPPEEIAATLGITRETIAAYNAMQPAPNPALTDPKAAPMAVPDKIVSEAPAPVEPGFAGLLKDKIGGFLSGALDAPDATERAELDEKYDYTPAGWDPTAGRYNAYGSWDTKGRDFFSERNRAAIESARGYLDPTSTRAPVLERGQESPGGGAGNAAANAAAAAEQRERDRFDADDRGGGRLTFGGGFAAAQDDRESAAASAAAAHEAATSAGFGSFADAQDDRDDMGTGFHDFEGGWGWHQGGYITDGNPATRLDDMPANIQEGEFMMSRQATQMYRPLLEMMNAGKLDPTMLRGLLGI